MEGVVAHLQGRPFRAGQLPEGVVECRSGKVGIETCQSIAEPSPQHDFAVVGAGRIGGDVGAVAQTPARAFKPFKCGGFGLRTRSSSRGSLVDRIAKDREATRPTTRRVDMLPDCGGRQLSFSFLPF